MMRNDAFCLHHFAKSTSPPLALREGPPLSPSPFPLRGQGMCQPPYSVLKPLRYKVGGPSEVSPAAELHFAVCDRMDTNRLRAAWCLLKVFSKIHLDFLSINEFFSKITPSLFTIKEGSTSFPKPLSPQGTGDVSTALLGAQTASL